MIERFDISLERPYEPLLDEAYTRALGSLGVVDASLYEYPEITSHEDSKWVIRSYD